MSEMQGKQRSAVVFGVRNLGRAVIELLVSDGWAVAGVARSWSTLDGVSASGALGLKADVMRCGSFSTISPAWTRHGSASQESILGSIGLDTHPPDNRAFTDRPLGDP